MLDFPVGRALKRLFDANEFPWLLPLPPGAGARDRQVRRIRRAARTALRRRDLERRGWVAVLAAAAAWPAVALLKAVYDVPRDSRPLRSRAAEVLSLWWLQLAHNLRLAAIHDYRLNEPAHRAKARRCVTDGENKYLLEVLNRDVPSRFLGDKRPFAEFCRRHHLPGVPVLATGAGAAAPALLAPWPAADLFLKPATLWGGQGARILRHDPARGDWLAPEGSRLTPDSIAAYAFAHFRDTPWLLQPRLTNGPEWAAFTPEDGALATLRAVTGRMLPAGSPQVVAGFMRFPRRGATVDNYCAGGIGSDYDPADGRLQPARSLEPRSPLFPRHPDTGAPLAGTRIPRWPEVAALACRAHEPISDIATIGWDIALTTDGLVLIEANPNWGVPLDTPLGDTAYVEFLLQPALAGRLATL